MPQLLPVEAGHQVLTSVGVHVAWACQAAPLLPREEVKKRMLYTCVH